MRSASSFDSVARLYDRARPPYPDDLIQDLFTVARLRPGDRVLEIGCGTGQITVPMARQGLHVTAVELGVNLAEIAGERLASFPHAEIVVGRFEDYELPREPFDLVVSATAFHWLDPAVRMTKAAEALSVGGHLAIIHTRWGVGREVDAFSKESQACYLRWDDEAPEYFRTPTLSDLSSSWPELDDFPGLGAVQYRQYEQARTYSRDEYLDLLRTFSNVNALGEHARSGLLECVGDLIDSRFGGTVVRNDLREMWTAERSE